MYPNKIVANTIRAITPTLTNHSWRLALGVITCAVVISGCASMPAPTEQLAVSSAAVTDATNAGATEFAAVEMKAAQDKLADANKAMATKDYKAALILAEQAQADAQLATIKSRAAKAHKAVTALDESTRVLHEEMNRNAK